MKRAQIAALLCGAAAIGVTSTLLVQRVSAAGIPQAGTLTYTGILEKPDGAPVTDRVNVRVSLWNAATAGSELCSQSKPDVTPVAGRFQVELPDACRTAVAANPNLWAQVEVSGSVLGRTKLGAVPYAVEAAHATTSDTAVSATLAATANAAGGALRTQIDATPKLSEWTVFTPTVHRDVAGYPAVTQATAPAPAGRWRRVGDSIEVMISSDFAAAATGNEGLLWKLPNNLAVLSTLAPLAALGSGWVYVTATNSFAEVFQASTDRHYVVLVTTGGALRPVDIGTGKIQAVRFRATIPVQGWTTSTP